MNIPSNLKYTKDHEWIRVEGAFAFIGITDFAQGELGDIVYLEIETVGENLAKEEILAPSRLLRRCLIYLCLSQVK